MSYDLHVYGVRELEGADIAELMSTLDSCRAVADGGGFLIERELRGSFTYAFHVDGPLRVEREDLPPDVAANAVAARWTYQLTVEGSSNAGAQIAQKFARSIAEQTDGVVYDPQVGGVTWPRGGTRRFKVEATETIDVLQLEWFVRREDAAPDLAEFLFDMIRTSMPEAMPRRFGSFEPLQFKLDEVGKTGFAEAWHEEPMMLFWKATRPCLGGYVHGLGSRLLFEPKFQHAVGSVRLDFDARVLRDERWKEELVDFFTRVCRDTSAFYAHAAFATNLKYRSGNPSYGPDSRSVPSLSVRNQWMGLPPFDVWLAWFGDLYRDVVLQELDAPLADVRGGLLFTPGGDGSAVEPVTQAARLPMPDRRFMNITESPLEGRHSSRATSFPDGLQ